MGHSTGCGISTIRRSRASRSIPPRRIRHVEDQTHERHGAISQGLCESSAGEDWTERWQSGYRIYIDAVVESWTNAVGYYEFGSWRDSGVRCAGAKQKHARDY